MNTKNPQMILRIYCIQLKLQFIKITQNIGFNAFVDI